MLRLWKTPCNQREKKFVWKCYNKGIPTFDRLNKANILPPPTFPLCNNQIETVEHALRNCIMVTPIWSAFTLPLNFSLETFKTWLYTNASNLQLNKLNIPWGSIFPFTLQTIWTCKNKKKIFQNVT